MPSILIVEDDSDQRQLRKMILERAGYTIHEASTTDAAASAALLLSPDCVLMDLRLPLPQDGIALLSRLHAAHPALPVVVLTGYPADLESHPAAPCAAAVLSKPVPTANLLRTLARLTATVLLLLLSAVSLPAQQFSFTSSGRGEIAATLELASPGADWARRGSEAAIARLTLDGSLSQHIHVWSGPARRAYNVVLGRLPAGAHTLRIERDPASAPAAALDTGAVTFAEILPEDPRYPIAAHAPVLHERDSARGRFSDIPLLMYATRLGPSIEYTVVFSNEDGGTSTRDLMARWGRATDIEFVYRVWPGPSGKPLKTLIQSRGHKEIPYAGSYLDLHPVLVPVTDNNMVEPAPLSPSVALRFRPLPVELPLDEGSRERSMDADPATYAVMARELEREGKLRPWGRFAGESIGDPRSYLYVEFESALDAAWIEAVVQPRGSRRWFRSSLGLAGDHIESPGWRRVAVELPPGTRERGLAALAFSCLSSRKLVKEEVPKNGRCTLLKLGRVFFLDDDYRPRESIRFSPPSRNGDIIGVGHMVAFEAF
jgi:CheY-like chemotaxis protein